MTVTYTLADYGRIPADVLARMRAQIVAAKGGGK